MSVATEIHDADGGAVASDMAPVTLVPGESAHDNGILGAAAIARAEERRVQRLKEAGFNAIRSSHNPISRAMLDACDEVGMLVIDEMFDVWTEGKTDFDYALAFPEWWERDVESMVHKDFNHPSVVLYAIGNEIFETGRAVDSGWGRKLAEKIRSLDGTRYITNGINGLVSVLPDVGDFMQQQSADGSSLKVNEMLQSGQLTERIMVSSLVTEKTAESQAVLDVAGMNYGDARYVMDRELFPNRIIVGTETFPTRIDANWKLVRENSHVIGDFTWTGWEYLGEEGAEGVHQGVAHARRDTYCSSGHSDRQPRLLRRGERLDRQAGRLRGGRCWHSLDDEALRARFELRAAIQCAPPAYVIYHQEVT